MQTDPNDMLRSLQQQLARLEARVEQIYWFLQSLGLIAAVASVVYLIKEFWKGNY